MRVEELRNNKEWENFLVDISDASFYHTLQWRDILQRSFSLRTIYLAIRNDDGRIVGVFPASMSTTGNLRILNSLPFSDLGGPIIEKKYLREASICLQNFLQEFSVKNNISVAKIRFLKNGPVQFFKSPRCYTDSNVGIVKLDIRAKCSSCIWQHVLNHTERKMIRRLERDGFQAREATTRSDLATFLRLYYQNMKEIGGKAFPRSFFENLWELLHPGNFDILLIEKDESVGGSAFFRYGKAIYATYVGIDKAALRAGHSLTPFRYWNLIKWAEVMGLQYIYFGSTPVNPRRISERAIYSQKVMFGGSLLRQEIVFIPYSSSAFFTLLLGSRAIEIWKGFRNVLPRKYENAIENRIAGIF